MNEEREEEQVCGGYTSQHAQVNTSQAEVSKANISKVSKISKFSKFELRKLHCVCHITSRGGVPLFLC